MKAKYVKQFFFFPDVFIMSIVFVISFGILVPHLTSVWTWAAFVLGAAGYTLTEYMTHRFLFHIKAPRNPIFLRFMKRIHYDHHSDPNDLHLLFLPLWYSVPNIVIVAGFVFLITSSLTITHAFITGVILLLLYYEWVHFIAHRPITPKTPWGKWMKKVHLWHHFKNENYWYGVTNPTFDFLMGTFKDQKDVELSQTARNLEKRGGQNLYL